MNEIITIFTHFWLQALFTLILSVLSVSVKKIFEYQKAQAEALQIILYNEICREAKAILKKGFITKEELHDLQVNFKAYEGLKGNGVAKKLYEECLNLEVRM